MCTASNQPQVNNYAFDDPVVQYIAPSYEMLLVIISQLYVAKVLVDCQQVGFCQLFFGEC